jgi:hypothetical protein
MFNTLNWYQRFDVIGLALWKQTPTEERESVGSRSGKRSLIATRLFLNFDSKTIVFRPNRWFSYKRLFLYVSKWHSSLAYKYREYTLVLCLSTQINIVFLVKQEGLAPTGFY